MTIPKKLKWMKIVKKEDTEEEEEEECHKQITNLDVTEHL